PPAEGVEFACELLGVEPPPLVPFDEAELSPMGRSFYADNKRVRNDRIKEELGVALEYPDYQAGLRELLCGGH
ncbi:MAG: SDR family NAD(P)-dependent oxidoreductase, partial [Proteobacteria bacterium]|nr:SDR family NAD(P)-dependent oxidoreductase [Pseudomonadota bacterium]